MAITLVGTFAAAASAVNNGGNITPALPTGYQAGDLLVAFCANFDGPNVTGFSATGQEYTELQTFAGVARVSLLVKEAASASETAPTISVLGAAGTGDVSLVRMAAFRGLRFSAGLPVSLVENTRATAAGTDGQLYPSLTTPGENGALILTLTACPNDYTTAPAAAGGFSIAAAETTTGNDLSFVPGYQIQTTAASIAQGSFGGNMGAVGCSSIIIALAEFAAKPISFAVII